MLVFPPENLTRSFELGWVSEAVAMSITEQLRIPGVEAIDRNERMLLLESADLPPNAPLSRASMIRVAQQASADWLIMGTYSGKPEELKFSLRVMDLKAMKLGNEISATGPVTALPPIENELAWIILGNAGLNNLYTRQRFVERTRSIPNRAYAQYIRALAHPDSADGIKMLEQAVALHQDIPDAQYLLGRHYYLASDYPQAIQHLTLARRDQGFYLDSEFMLGTSYLHINQLDEAARAFEAMSSFGQFYEALNNLGVVNLRRKDFPLATQSLVDAHHLARADTTVCLNLGLLRYLEGNHRAAREVLEEAKRAHPSNPMILYLLSLTLRAQGETQNADAALADARRAGLDLAKVQGKQPLELARIYTVWQHRD